MPFLSEFANLDLRFCATFQGFKLKLAVPLKKANDISVVVRKGEVFFPVALGEETVGGVLAEGIFQGRLN